MSSNNEQNEQNRVGAAQAGNDQRRVRIFKPSEKTLCLVSQGLAGLAADTSNSNK
jgi:hypothetical protein